MTSLIIALIIILIATIFAVTIRNKKKKKRAIYKGGNQDVKLPNGLTPRQSEETEDQI